MGEWVIRFEGVAGNVRRVNRPVHVWDYVGIYSGMGLCELRIGKWACHSTAFCSVVFLTQVAHPQSLCHLFRSATNCSIAARFLSASTRRTLPCCAEALFLHSLHYTPLLFATVAPPSSMVFVFAVLEFHQSTYPPFLPCVGRVPIFTRSNSLIFCLSTLILACSLCNT